MKFSEWRTSFFRRKRCRNDSFSCCAGISAEHWLKSEAIRSIQWGSWDEDASSIWGSLLLHAVDFMFIRLMFCSAVHFILKLHISLTSVDRTQSSVFHHRRTAFCFSYTHQHCLISLLLYAYKNKYFPRVWLLTIELWNCSDILQSVQSIPYYCTTLYADINRQRLLASNRMDRLGNELSVQANPIPISDNRF